jgi:hypothetical protein
MIVNKKKMNMMATKKVENMILITDEQSRIFYGGEGFSLSFRSGGLAFCQAKLSFPYGHPPINKGT